VPSIILFPHILKRTKIRAGVFRPLYAILIFLSFVILLALGWIGGLSIIYPYHEIGQVLTGLYFFIISIALPFNNYFE
jgi:hypothetical protein